MKTAAPGNILVRMVPAAALAAFLGLAASGETLVWNPEGSGGWGSDTRWQGGGLPDTGDTVSFSGCTGLVTAADAAYTGMDRIAKILTNGAAVAGTVIGMLPQESRAALDGADVVLAKGQGNYESLSGQGRHIYYSFLCKCDLFMKRFNVPKLTGMLAEQGRSEASQ